MANRNQEIETPDNFLAAVQRFFDIKFVYDMACTENNAKFRRWKDDNLSCTWSANDWCWLNPPFRNVGDWMDKCFVESENGAHIISICPLSSDKNMIVAWEHADIYIIHGRVWAEVRSVMLCVWHKISGGKVRGLQWDRNAGTLTKLW